MEQVNVKINLEEIVGKIKPLHAVNDVPSATFAYGGAKEGVDFFVHKLGNFSIAFSVLRGQKTASECRRPKLSCP